MEAVQRFDRTARLLGAEGIERLRGAFVAVFGLGGVGSYCAEALARSGVGKIRLVDHDEVSVTNCNRQLEALHSTVGQKKTRVLAVRLMDINPDVYVEEVTEFFDRDAALRLLGGGLSFVVDAVDSLSPKVDLLDQCRRFGVPVVSVLGAAGRLDPTLVRVASLAQTKMDPLAVQVRKRLRRRRSLDDIWAVYSEERPVRTHDSYEGPAMTSDLFRGRQRTIQPSAVMVPATMGMAAASVVIRELIAPTSEMIASPKT